MGWYSVRDLCVRQLTVKSSSRLSRHGLPVDTSTHSALRSVPTATVRTHLPGLFSSEPLKG